MLGRPARWLAVGVLGAGLGFGALGIASAASSPSTPRPGSSAAPGTDQPHAGQHAGQAGRHRHRFLRRVSHGEFVLRGRMGARTVAVQRGEITKVSPASITLKSIDGYSSTYAIDSATRVRAKGQPETVADLKVGQRAMVFADKTDTGFVAKRIGCLREGGKGRRPLPGSASDSATPSPSA